MIVVDDRHLRGKFSSLSCGSQLSHASGSYGSYLYQTAEAVYTGGRRGAQDQSVSLIMTISA